MHPTRPSLRSPAISVGAIVLGLMVPALSPQVRAGDWPQILGAQRNGQATLDSPLATDWKSNGPKILWRFPVSSGYAGAAIAGGQAFLFDRYQDSERLTAVELTSGKQRWQVTWPASYASSIDPDSGPRAVPTVTGNFALCYGAAGDLVCVEATKGKIVWQRSLRRDFDADLGYFGAGSSPLVIGETVVVNAGGKKGGIVGIDLKNGSTRWQATDYDASYAAPVSLFVSGQPAALVVTRLRTVLVDVATGEVLSEIDFGARGPTVNAATPLAVGQDRYLLTASYGIGAHLIKLNGKKIERVWKQVDLLASQYNSPVLLGGQVIGVDGREDLGEVSLKGIDVDKPAVLWEIPLSGPTHLIAAGEHVVGLAIDGNLMLAQLVGGKLQRTAEFAIAQTSSGRDRFRALPAMADHVLVVRRTQGAEQGEFIALQLP